MKKLEKNKIPRKRIGFSLHAPNAKEVSLMGDFNQWKKDAHPMKNDGTGTWKKIAMLPKGRHEYKFLVDDEWEQDPANQQVCPNRYGTSNNVIIAE